MMMVYFLSFFTMGISLEFQFNLAGPGILNIWGGGGGAVKRGDFCFLISHLYRYFIIFHVSGNILFKSIIWIITRPSLVSKSKCKVQFNVPAGNYMFKVNNGNTGTRYIFIINFEHVSQVVLLFLL